MTRWHPRAMSRELISALGVLHLGSGEDRRGAVAVQLVDGQARALDENEGVVSGGTREHTARFVEIQPRDERLRSPCGVRLSARGGRRTGRKTYAEHAKQQAKGPISASSEQPFRIAPDRLLERAAARLPEPAHHATAKLFGALVVARDHDVPVLRLLAFAVAGRRRARLSVLFFALQVLARRLEVPLRLPLPREPLVCISLLERLSGLVRGLLRVIDRLYRFLRKGASIPPFLAQVVRALGEAAPLPLPRAPAGRARAPRPSASADGGPPQSISLRRRACDEHRRRAFRRPRSGSSRPAWLRSSRLASSREASALRPLSPASSGRPCSSERAVCSASSRAAAPLLVQESLPKPTGGKSRTASRTACACRFASSRIWFSSSSLVAAASACSTLAIAPA